MPKFLASIIFLAIICPGAALFAQNGREISDADRKAVTAYTESINALEQKMRDVRREIREKNSVLAKALAPEGAAFKEADVIAAHKALTESYAKVAETELEELLLYKAYHPEWKPGDDGRRVAVPGERERRREGREGEGKEAPVEKKAR